MALCGVYKIQSKEFSDRCYIGSAINIKDRWRRHLGDLKRNNHRSTKLQNHYNKYGELDLEFSVIVSCDKEDLIKIEQFYLDAYKSWFNICPTAGNSLGYKHTKESKIKMHNSHINKKRKPHTEETKNIMRMQKLGDNNPAKRPEVREKIRNTLLGRKPSKESIIKREITKAKNKLYRYGN